MKTQMAIVVLAGAMALACGVLSRLFPQATTQGSICPPLPGDFKVEDLVGTWVARYHGGLDIDMLIIRQDGLYRQVFSGSNVNFESEWREWRLDYDADGYGLLHLAGMRRCDGIETTCDDPGGGLPPGILAVNQCEEENLVYSDEVILFVTGGTDLPRGIELQQARMAGVDYYYTFQLER